jgi:hypothetical protein
MKRHKTKAERIADDVFTIIDSGLANRPGPYPLLVDDDRAMLPWQMGRADIIALIRHRYGREFASYVAETEALTIH